MFRLCLLDARGARWPRWRRYTLGTATGLPLRADSLAASVMALV